MNSPKLTIPDPKRSMTLSCCIAGRSRGARGGDTECGEEEPAMRACKRKRKRVSPAFRLSVARLTRRSKWRRNAKFSSGGRRPPNPRPLTRVRVVQSATAVAAPTLGALGDGAASPRVRLLGHYSALSG